MSSAPQYSEDPGSADHQNDGVAGWRIWSTSSSGWGGGPQLDHQ
jgi:hypothetical protein